jgi:rhodanese-related sulfurtransferase
MPKTAMEMVAEAKSKVPAVTPEEASTMDNVVFVDLREAAEIEATGKIAGAVAIPRGLLEFKADPSHPYHVAEMDPGKTVVTYCASGGRAALAAAMLKDMGYEDVRHMGAFKDWAEKGLPIDKG